MSDSLGKARAARTGGLHATRAKSHEPAAGGARKRRGEGRIQRREDETRGDFTLGRDRFARISAVEGIRLSREMEQDFREFDRKGLSPEERRRAIIGKYGRKRA